MSDTADELRPGIPLQELPAIGRCRWPLWANERPGDERYGVFCGDPTRDVLCPYCEHHAKRGMTPMPPRRPR